MHQNLKEAFAMLGQRQIEPNSLTLQLSPKFLLSGGCVLKLVEWTTFIMSKTQPEMW